MSLVRENDGEMQSAALSGDMVGYAQRSTQLIRELQVFPGKLPASGCGGESGGRECTSLEMPRAIVLSYVFPFERA